HLLGVYRRPVRGAPAGGDAVLLHRRVRVRGGGGQGAHRHCRGARPGRRPGGGGPDPVRRGRGCGSGGHEDAGLERGRAGDRADLRGPEHREQHLQGGPAQCRGGGGGAGAAGAAPTGQRPVPRGLGHRHREHGGDHRHPGPRSLMSMTAERVLVINAGSSSLKYQVVDADTGHAVASGLVERVGQSGAHLRHANNGEEFEKDLQVPDHTAAMAAMDDAFATYGPDLAEEGLVAVGHRVVQGGARFGHSVLIDDEAEHIIEDLSDLAPLHNPPNLAGIRAARKIFTDLPHVAVFDTSFHLTMPDRAATYALDREVAKQYRVRRYGAHGTSHQYVAREAAHFLGLEAEEANLIVLHLGNGASVTAVQDGRSVDTSMGLTPLEGLVMGTRTGDIDPAVVFHLARHADRGIDGIDELMNRRPGMFGLTGM